ncbi:MAG: hypothetical protein RIT81_32065 [Deltaproteobacteria bacterium]
MQGASLVPPPYGTPFGYYDPIHNVFVVANTTRQRRVWVFRYGDGI